MIPVFSPLTGLAGMVRSLFSAGEPGVWYDPSDLSTLFQDAYGTTPVTAVGQPVGLILDKSKRVIFKTTKADLLDNAKWTGYNSVGGNRPTAVQLADGTVRITRNSTDTYVGFAPMANAYSLPPGCVVHFKYSVRSNTNLTQFAGEPYDNWRNVNPNSFGYIPSASVLTKNTVAINYTAAPITTSGAGWASYLLGFYMSGAGHAADEYIDVFDFEITAYAPAARQLTTASRPTLQQDTSGKYYLSFDGVDDYLSTGSINFTATDKMTVLAGLRKLSDAAAGILCELSADRNTNNSTFSMSAPAGGGNQYLFASRGTIDTAWANVPPSTYPTPHQAVLTGIGNISGDQSILRVNGVQAAQSVGDQGSGNFGTYPLYIGRRGGTQLQFNGRLYGLIVRGAQTDDAHLTHAEKYLAYKSGVTL